MIHSRCGTLCAALLLLLTVPLWAQDREATRDSTRFTETASGSASLQKREALHKNFVIGFNWGEVPQDSADFKALRIKVVHEGMWLDFNPNSNSSRALRNQYPSGTGIIHAHSAISQGELLPYAWASAMQFDPAVGDRGTVYRFTPRLGDTTGATWGFRVRDTLVGPVMLENLANSILDNYGRMLLQDTLLEQRNQQLGYPLTTPHLVLSQPSPDVLQFYDEIDGLRKDFDAVMKHPDNVQPYKRTDMFVRDSRRAWNQMQVKRYFRDTDNVVHYDSLITTYAPVGFDTLMRGRDTVMIHMRGDSSGWYLTANLRRLFNPAQSGISANLPVLSLRVPVCVRYDTVYYDQYGKPVKDSSRTGVVFDTLYARFDSTSVAADTVISPTYGIMDKTLAAYDSTTFYIRAGMLPPDDYTVGIENRPDVTLSAHFWLPRFASNNRYETLQPKNTGQPELLPPPGGGNVVLSPPWPGYPRTVVEPVVERVNMDVTYHGNVDVALDWLRFETRMARMILRGYKDSIIINKVRETYQKIDSVAPGHGVWLYAHFMADESNPVYWRTQRHISRLLEDAGTTETGSFYRGHYAHQTGDKQHWISWLGPVTSVAAPYIRYGNGGKNRTDTAASWLARDDRSLGLNSGYQGIRYLNGSNAEVKETQDYETTRRTYDISSPKYGSLWTMNDSLYTIVLGESPSVQATIEYGMNERVMHSYDMLYGNIPVWYNSWLYSEWKTRDNIYADKIARSKTAGWSFTRPHTGEEVRVINWLALALGAKGLMPYKGGSAFSGEKGEYGLTVSPSANGTSGRYFPSGQTSGSKGGDFLDSLHTIWQFLKPDSMASFMGVPKNRIYVGTRSMFEELADMHTYADTHGPELMRLQLQAVYNKGYKLATSARDTSIHLERFIDTALVGSQSKFHVRRLHNRYGGTWVTGDEPFQDSTFFLVTLLKDSAKNMDATYYVACVNRRVDPTVYYPPSGGTNLGDSVKFFSTTEFDSLVSSSALNSRYTFPEYAQHGARQITLPLQFGHLLQDSMFSLIRIREVGGTLDTIIAEDRCEVSLSPFSGQVFKVVY